MDFALSDEQQMIADTARAFFSENATCERTRQAMAAGGADAGIDRELWRAFCTDLGLSGVGIAEAAGGAGLGLVELALVAEAAGAQVAALPMLGSLALCAQAVAAGGTAAQRDAILPALLSGEAIAAYVHDPALRAEGDLLTGESRFVLHGGAAQWFVVTSNSGAWIVPADAPGVTVRIQTTMDQTRPLACVTLTGAQGQPLTDPPAAIARAHTCGFITLAAEALGGAQATLDRTVAYAMERVQFGRPIASFQAYKHRLADMMIEIEQARSAVWWAACAADEASDEADLAVHAAKAFCADTYFMCAGNMIQLHGGIGFTWEHDAHLYFKRSRAIMSSLGDGAWHREQVATHILGALA
ncbi:MAG: acyl-CoA dehydrogenase family protein [Proteobacteria bacterium]|nr:acyl-CoA dehydrogenase family protein [Pseudomonadota bacterium]